MGSAFFAFDSNASDETEAQLNLLFLLVGRKAAIFALTEILLLYYCIVVLAVSSPV